MAAGDPSSQPTRVFDFLWTQLSRFPKPVALAHKVSGAWKPYSTEEVVRVVEALAWGLKGLSVTKGDRIATLTETNRPEWNFIDIAVMSLGAVHVPIYPNISMEEHAYILQNSGAKYAFVSSQRLFDSITQLKAQLPDLLNIYTFDRRENTPHWEEIRTQGESALSQGHHRSDLQAIRDSVRPEDLATLIYTSGTTGTPKGVMLSHANLVSNCLVATSLLKSGPAETALSFLPLCHIYERTIVNIYLNSGTSIYYAESLDTIGTNLREVRPHIFSSVPRLLEKIYEKILERGETLTGLKRKIFFWALGIATQFDPENPPRGIRALGYLLADRLVFSKWREAFGGRVRAIMSGSAALQPLLARVFWAAKIPVYEGYGPTEASPVISVNHFGKLHKIGTVGPVIPGGEVKIAEDGEILYRGPNVMMGYYQRPELTAEVIDADGWLHTGDVGEFDGEFLKITDRKKEIFKTSGGKYIAPQQIENKMKESKFISQVMVIGENHKFPAALIVPNFSAVSEVLGKKPIEPAAMVEDPEVLSFFDSEVDRLNENFGRYMKIKKFALLAREWSLAGGELTPTMKLKRKQILTKYAGAIAKIYSGEERGVESLKGAIDTAKR